MEETIVNPQITDTVTDEAQDGQESLTRQIHKASYAFTRTLEMENIVFQNQLNGAIAMTVNAIQSMIAVCKEAITIETDSADFQQSLASVKQQALSDIQNANPGKQETPAVAAAPGSNPANEELASVLVQCVGESYKNAVSAQQKMYITQQAAATMIITSLLSIATATVSVAVSKAEDQGATV